MQSIEFTITTDDIVAFNVYQMQKRGTLKSATAGAYLRFVLFYLLLMLIVFAFSPGWSRVVFEFVVGIALLPVVFPYLKRRTLADAMASIRFWSEKCQKGVVGWHRVSLGEDAIQEEGEVSSSTWKYSCVDCICEDVEYVFVYLNALKALTIPRRGVDSAILAAFLQALRSKIEIAPTPHR